VFVFSARPLAASTAASVMVTAMAAVAFLADARAAQPTRHAIAQRAAPFQRAMPGFHATPVQHVMPPTVTSRPTPAYMNANRPVGVMPMFTHPRNGNNFQAVNPNVQRVNPNLPFNNPAALRPNVPPSYPTALSPLNNPRVLSPNLPLNNQGAPGPNLPLNNSNVVQQRTASPPYTPALAGEGRVGGATPKPGTIQPLANPALLKPGAGGFQQVRPTSPSVHLHDRFWPILKDSKFMFVRGQRRLFTPVGLLGVVLIGGSYWYPDGYVSMEGPACTGFTPDGCQLQWRTVDFEDGGGEPQCVQYCPQVGPAPEQVATLPPPPPVAENGACQTTIYSEPNFAGNSAPTGYGQPNLSETGWRNEISSIVVGAGTWDFFADENFGGESMRLSPGTYPTLSAEWTRRIGSFMCVQPGPPPA
jgi:Beta/Gamma crystallin